MLALSIYPLGTFQVLGLMRRELNIHYPKGSYLPLQYAITIVTS